MIRVRASRHSLMAVLTASAVGITAVSCNIFDPLDSPGGEAQLLSAARACFDAGDFECAREYYGQLSGTTEADVAASEMAFAMLDEVGAGMKAFLPAVTKKGAGGIMTSMANSLIPTRGQATRKSLYEAYKKANEISSASTELKGLTRFVTAFALAAEILAEEAGSDGALTQRDLASDVATCSAAVAAGGPPIFTCAGCTSQQTAVVQGGTLVDLLAATLPDSTAFNDPPTWGMFHGAVKAINDGLSQMNGGNSSGVDMGGGLAGLDNATLNTYVQSDTCYRQQLLSQGIGQ